MRFRCDREELLKAVQDASGVVASKGVHPVYESVEIVAAADALTFLATDLEIGMKLRVAASEKVKVEQPGTAVVPAQRLGSIVRELAKGEVRQGRAKKGYELLLAEVGREQSERGRFLRQVQLAFLMVEAGMDTVARPILERLVATVDEKSLEQWEAGPLVAQPMALLIRVLDRAGETESSERYQLYQRICKLDTLQAMALQTG